MADIRKCFGEIGGLHQEDLTKFQKTVNKKYMEIIASGKGLSQEDAAVKAIDESIKERSAEMSQKAYAKLVNIKKQNELFNEMNSQDRIANAVANDMTLAGTGLNSNVQSLSSRKRGILLTSQQILNNIHIYTMKSNLVGRSVRALGFGEEKALVNNVLHAMINAEYGITKPDKKIDAAAQKIVNEYHGDVTNLAQRIKKAGGSIESKTLPNPVWDRLRLAKIGVESWTSDWMSHLSENVDKYRHLFLGDNGNSMFYDEYGQLNLDNMTRFIEKSFEDIVSEREILDSYGMPFQGRLGQQIKMHIRDADFWQDMNEKYGSSTLSEVLDGRLNDTSTYLASIEMAGPDAPNNFAKAIQKNNKMAFDNAKLTDEQKRKQGKDGEEAIKKFNYFNNYNQNQYTLEANLVAKMIQGSRNLFTTFFGKSNIWGLSDIGSSITASAAMKSSGGYSAINTMVNFGKSFNKKEYYQYLNNMGFMESVLNEHTYRDWSDFTNRGWTTFTANTFSRLAKLSRGDKAKREVYTQAFMNGLGGILKNVDNFASIPKESMDILVNRGFNESDFKVLKLAKLEEGVSTNHLLTVKNILDIPDSKVNAISDGLTTRMVAEKLLGIISLEGDLAVTRPTDIQRFDFSGIQKNTIVGELALSLLSAKTFLIAWPKNQLTRMASMDSKMAMAQYGTGLAIRSILLGAVAQQAVNLLAGKDLEDMNPMDSQEFWGKVSLNSIGAGIAVDIGSGIVGGAGKSVLPGTKPLTAIAKSVYDPIFGGKEFSYEQLGASILQAGVEYSPLTAPIYRQAYAKLFMDRLFMDELTNIARPGSMDRMNRRIEKQGVTYWSKPGTALSESRPPEMQDQGE